MKQIVTGSAAEPQDQVSPGRPEPVATGDAEQFRGLREQLAIVMAGLERLAPHLDGEPAGMEALQTSQIAILRCVELAGRLPAEAGPAGDVSGRGRTVLAVDDNAALRRVVVRQLKDLGYRVLEADDGPAALMILNSEPVDLLFTDVVMPGGMSGFDLARLVLSRWPKMKALITSGFPDIEPHSDSAIAGKLRRLIKPYRKADLANMLQDVFDQPEAGGA